MEDGKSMGARRKTISQAINESKSMYKGPLGYRLEGRLQPLQLSIRDNGSIMGPRQLFVGTASAVINHRARSGLSYCTNSAIQKHKMQVFKNLSCSHR